MTRICFRALPLLIGLFVLRIGHADEPNATGYKVQKKIQVGGDGGWDYITMDSDARRLYISRSNRVQVVDVDEGKVVGEIPNTPGVHGIAIAPKHKKGFSSNGGDSTVSVFDVESLKETARVKVGQGPDAIMYDATSDRIFTFNARSNDATAISAETNEVAGTVKLEGRPEAGVADEKGMAYVNIVNKNEIVAFDAKKLEVKSHWPLGEGKGPHGLAIDLKKRRLFSTCSNQKMVVLDADSGKILETLTIGRGTDAAGFDQEKALAFSSNGDGTLTIVGEEPAGQYKVLANVPTQPSARTMAVDTKTHKILLAAATQKKAAEGQKSRPGMEPGSFVIVVVGK
jgi:YVTN family beta-propeller protein